MSIYISTDSLHWPGPDEATRSPTAVPNPEGGNDIYIAIKK
jgi:hypothetical protein